MFVDKHACCPHQFTDIFNDRNIVVLLGVGKTLQPNRSTLHVNPVLQVVTIQGSVIGSNPARRVGLAIVTASRSTAKRICMVPMAEVIDAL